MHAVDASNLLKRFGDRTAVDRISLTIPSHGVFGLLGPNGAGKTTLMRLMLGLIKADGGTTRIFGFDVRRDRLAALRHVGVFLEAPSLYEHLTGRKNLAVRCRLRGIAREAIDVALDITGMAYASNKIVRTYSLGMKQRLAIAQALLGQPKLLILDEPTNGLDPDGIADVRRLIAELPDRIGGSVLLSSHLLSEVEMVAQQIAIVRDGRVVANGELCALLGGNRELLVETADSARALSILHGIGLSARSAGGGIMVMGENDVAERVRINRALVEGGCNISGLVVRAKTLEDLYADFSPPASASLTGEFA
ncbi:ABC transporter ATP-binding protein [Sphingopyxis sp.]|uniref:ABC transporter ATP-binding protein n=1 Tax=Sphingopyxis sp. TaxID=1908224 RepID=UPI003D150182